MPKDLSKAAYDATMQFDAGLIDFFRGAPEVKLPNGLQRKFIREYLRARGRTTTTAPIHVDERQALKVYLGRVTRWYNTFYAICAFCGVESLIETEGSNYSSTFQCKHDTCDDKDKIQYTKYHKEMQPAT
ncbi:hypothetical protein HBI46_038620 [Parastagonospora nodorum]|nr:hypothetical protein HBI71_071330 [Parastagonospora nodorum]KAH5425781.1 hypothetical protein HBI46_038620 [Parastagonospora nodorum]KAH6236052.1 hypothetical protein HBI43_005690 [Parastagonospora nodorum]KAH6257375.1 hypothetical protein HBI42_107560 [Parastagonospora nodorum]